MEDYCQRNNNSFLPVIAGGSRYLLDSEVKAQNFNNSVISPSPHTIFNSPKKQFFLDSSLKKVDAANHNESLINTRSLQKDEYECPYCKNKYIYSYLCYHLEECAKSKEVKLENGLEKQKMSEETNVDQSISGALKTLDNQLTKTFNNQSKEFLEYTKTLNNKIEENNKKYEMEIEKQSQVIEEIKNEKKEITECLEKVKSELVVQRVNFEKLYFNQCARFDTFSSSVSSEINKLKKQFLEAQNTQIREEHLCVVCLNKNITHIIKKCCHACLCEDCGLKLKECPVCRTVYAKDDLSKFYLS